MNLLIFLNIIAACTPILGENPAITIDLRALVKTLSNGLNILRHTPTGVLDAAVTSLVHNMYPRAGEGVEPLVKVKLQGSSKPALVLRKFNEYSKPGVILGTGAFKSEIIKYPPNHFKNRLKVLLKVLKEKEENEKEG